VNTALDRMHASTASLWVGFTSLMVVSGVLGLIGLALPLVLVFAGIGFSISNFVLLGAIFSTVMSRHADVVAEAGVGHSSPAVTAQTAAGATATAALPGTFPGALQSTLQSTPPVTLAAAPQVAQNQSIAPSLPTAAEQEESTERGEALSGPVDFSAYPEGQITMITRRLKQLSPEQRLAWDRAGRPNLSKWSGTDFDSWMSEA
jgi:hypothetical protein